MADLNSILNNLSVGATTVSDSGPTTFTTSPSRNNVVTKVNEYREELDGGKTLVFPSDIPKYFFELRWSKYKRANFDVTSVKFKELGSMYLPLPQGGMIDAHDIDYEERELGLAGAAGSVAGGENGVDALKGIGIGVGTSVGDILTGGQFGGAAQAAFGYAPNQFLTILLKGPRYKRHEFTWKLFPRNNKESETIRQMIKELNNGMAPEYKYSKTLFGFPYVYWMGYRPNSKYLYKFKPAVLENLTVNYTPQGSPAFFHASPGDENNLPPEAVELRMRFLELEFWIKGDFTDSNDPYAGAKGRAEGFDDPIVKPKKKFNPSENLKEQLDNATRPSKNKKPGLSGQEQLNRLFGNNN